MILELTSPASNTLQGMLAELGAAAIIFAFGRTLYRKRNARRVELTFVVHSLATMSTGYGARYLRVKNLSNEIVYAPTLWITWENENAQGEIEQKFSSRLREWNGPHGSGEFSQEELLSSDFANYIDPGGAVWSETSIGRNQPVLAIEFDFYQANRQWHASWPSKTRSRSPTRAGQTSFLSPGPVSLEVARVRSRRRWLGWRARR